jgi:hypothetical protein
MQMLTKTQLQHALTRNPDDLRQGEPLSWKDTMQMAQVIYI